jgi:hypothetical protein
VTLIEYRSGLISLLSLDARRAFTGPYSDDCRRHFSPAPRSHLLKTVVVRTRPQTERATDSALFRGRNNADCADLVIVPT